MQCWVIDVGMDDDPAEWLLLLSVMDSHCS